GDFDGDGRSDLAVVNAIANTVSVLIARADGFAPHVDYAVREGPTAVVVADFNRDGHADLAVSTHGNGTGGAQEGVSILLGHGDGTFAPERRSTTLNDAEALAVADFDGDGLLDLAVAKSQEILRGDGNGGFTHMVSLQ